jgi:hypothetical protein
MLLRELRKADSVEADIVMLDMIGKGRYVFGEVRRYGSVMKRTGLEGDATSDVIDANFVLNGDLYF